MIESGGVYSFSGHIRMNGPQLVWVNGHERYVIKETQHSHNHYSKVRSFEFIEIKNDGTVEVIEGDYYGGYRWRPL